MNGKFFADFAPKWFQSLQNTYKYKFLRQNFMLHVRGNRVPKYYPNSEQSMVTPHIFLNSINPSGTKLYADKKNKQILSVANMPKIRKM